MSSPLQRLAATQRILALAVLLLLFSGVRNSASQENPTAGADTPEAHLGKGYEALKQDQYDVAAGEFRAALKLDPKLVLRAQFPLAVALFEMHQSDDARQQFEAVRREEGDHPNILYYLGRLDLEDHNFPAAIKNLNQAVAKPPFPDTSYYLGYAYFKQDDLKDAEKWLKEAAQTNPHDARVQYQLVLVYRREGLDDEAKKAMELSEELRQRDSNDSKLRLECVKKLEQGLREEAHAVCDQLYDPENAEKLTALGTMYGQNGDFEAALKPLRRAAELAPESPQMQYNLALTYYQANQFEQARAPLANSIKRWPDLFQLNALYGAVLLKLGEDLPAYDALQHAHQLNPQDSGTVDLLYIAAMDLGQKTLAQKNRTTNQYSDALRYFEEAAKLRPQEPAPHQSMAEVYTLAGRTAQATAEQQEADRLAKSLGKLQ
jgi:tetratricopeptide (TPR) repeat protein